MEKYLQGFCDIMACDDNRTSWDEPVGTCKSFKQKDKQVVESTMIPYCLEVCGNCEYFTVGEVVRE